MTRLTSELADNRLGWRGLPKLMLYIGCIASGTADGCMATAGGQTLLMHADSSYETAYAWDEGNYHPDYGAFAERYEGHASIGAIVLDLTSTPGYNESTLDAYVWGDEGGKPGDVLFAVYGISDIITGQWPAVARNVVALLQPPCVEGTWWVGYWGDYVGGWVIPFFVGADLDGPGGGFPATKIAPGQGYPTGWQDVSVRWGPTAALGIGAEVDSCPPTPTQDTTWGEIKGLFR